MAKLAATAHLSVEQFREQFESLIADEPPSLMIGPGSDADGSVSVFHPPSSWPRAVRCLWKIS